MGKQYPPPKPHGLKDKLNKQPSIDPFKKKLEWDGLVEAQRKLMGQMVKITTEDLEKKLFSQIAPKECGKNIVCNFTKKESTFDPEKDMIWITQTGRQKLISKMLPDHVFNCTRLLYNQMIPMECRLPCPSHTNHVEIRSATKIKGLQIFLFHCKRHLKEFTDRQLQELQYMLFCLKERYIL